MLQKIIDTLKNGNKLSDCPHGTAYLITDAGVERIAQEILELRLEITACVYLDWIKYVGENESTLGFSDWLYRERIESGVECLTVGWLRPIGGR